MRTGEAICETCGGQTLYGRHLNAATGRNCPPRAVPFPDRQSEEDYEGPVLVAYEPSSCPPCGGTGRSGGVTFCAACMGTGTVISAESRYAQAVAEQAPIEAAALEEFLASREDA